MSNNTNNNSGQSKPSNNVVSIKASNGAMTNKVEPIRPLPKPPTPKKKTN